MDPATQVFLVLGGYVAGAWITYATVCRYLGLTSPGAQTLGAVLWPATCTLALCIKLFARARR